MAKKSKLNVFAVWGVEPEVGGYGIAKYSRSLKPYKETISRLNRKKAGEFYRKFYLEYHHKSVADLAHTIFIFENISNYPAREALWDDALLDGQESSTRYLDFHHQGLRIPTEIADSPFRNKAKRLGEKMVQENAALQILLQDYLVRKLRRLKHYQNLTNPTLNKIARQKAFDIARYVLPVGHYTKLGLLMNGRTAERLANNLLIHPLKEVRDIGEAFKKAASQKPAFIPLKNKLEKSIKLAGDIKSQNEKLLVKRLKRLAPANLVVLPTICSFIKANRYRQEVFEKLQKWAEKNIQLRKIDFFPQKKVRLIRQHNLELETLVSFLYRVTPYSYGQLLNFVEKLSLKKRKELFKIIYALRGKDDELLGEMSSGYRLIFDITSDFGVHKDLHRHRRCLEIAKPFSSLYGYETPQDFMEAGIGEKYQKTMKRSGDFVRKIEKSSDSSLRMAGAYLLGYGWRRRYLLKMDARELQYIVELRTRPEGHFAYREIAWLMYQEFAKRFPNQARYIRAISPNRTA